MSHLPLAQSAYSFNPPLIVSLENADQGWKETQSEIAKADLQLSDFSINFLRSGLESFARSLVVERKYVCKDHSNLHQHFYSTKFAQRNAHCARLHFFSSSDIKPFELAIPSAEVRDAYIGCAIVRPIVERSLGVVMINPGKIGRGAGDGNYVLATDFRVHLFGTEFRTLAYPYYGPDGDALLCGHTAIWGICRYLSERRTRYAEMRPYDLLSLVHRQQGRLLPERATDVRDYSELLLRFGAHPVILRTKDDRPQRGFGDPAFRDICTYVESGVPTLVSFEEHAVVLIGHTLDFDRPAISLPGRPWLIDHSSFFATFVISDGNHFPYSQLLFDSTDAATKSQPDINKSGHYSIEDIKAAVCPLPEKVHLLAAAARNMALNLIDSLKPEIEQQFGVQRYVMRLFFTTATAFKAERLSFLKRNGSLGNCGELLAYTHLPHFVWVAELAPIDTYRAGNCITELLIDATAGPLDRGFVFARVGSTIFHAHVGREKYDDCPVEVPLFKHNLGRTAPEYQRHL